MAKLTFLCAVLCMAIFSFAGKPIAPPSGVQGSWMVVTQLDAKGNMDDLATGSLITFDLRTKKITASVGCNTMMGDWIEKKKQNIKKVTLMTTLMACDADLMQAEALFSKNISKITCYKFNGTMLELYNGKKLIMVLKRS